MQDSTLKKKLKNHSYVGLRGTCSECGCYIFAAGLCTRHYRIQWSLKRNGPPKVNSPLKRLNEELEAVDLILTDSRAMRDKITGTPTRVFWRSRIRSAEIERRRILKEIARATT